MPNRDDSRRAFTLIELLAVILIMGIGVSYIGMAAYRHLDETLLRASSRRVMQTARYGRMLAAQQHRRCRLHIDLDAGTYWLTSSQSGVPLEEWTEPQRMQQEQEIASIYARKRQLDEKVRFVLAQTAQDDPQTTGVATIDFNQDGSSQAALVQMTVRDKTYTLLIYPWSGKVELQAQAVDRLPSEWADDSAATVLPPAL